MIKFITESDDKKKVAFDSIAVNQFFISSSGYLLQKIDDNDANSIADNMGNPYAFKECFTQGEMVTPLPHVYKIRFSAE